MRSDSSELRSSRAIPQRTLLPFLQLLLQSKGFTIADLEQLGWKQIVPATALLTNAARPTMGPATQPATGAVTQVFSLRTLDAARMELLLRPFLSQPGGNVIGISEARLLIATDYALNMKRLAELARLTDQPTRDVVVEFVPLDHGDAQDVSAKAAQTMQATISTTGAPNRLG